MPDLITRRSAAGVATARFWYGAEHQRIKSETVAAGTTTAVVYLNPQIDLGGTYEEATVTNGTATVTSTAYVYAGGEVVGAAVKTGDTTSMRYFLKDHLGSISGVMDSAGAKIDTQSFDEWGNRRLPTGGVDNGTHDKTRHGYTGHEELDAVGLVHMNGRLYDPAVGRFLSPDPNVFRPGDMQDYNRYSYVHNNPLSFTDPSGYLASADNNDLSGTNVGNNPSLDNFIAQHLLASFGQGLRISFDGNANGFLGVKPSSEFYSKGWNDSPAFYASVEPADDGSWWKRMLLGTAGHIGFSRVINSGITYQDMGMVSNVSFRVGLRLNLENEPWLTNFPVYDRPDVLYPAKRMLWEMKPESWLERSLYSRAMQEINDYKATAKKITGQTWLSGNSDFIFNGKEEIKFSVNVLNRVYDYTVYPDPNGKNTGLLIYRAEERLELKLPSSDPLQVQNGSAAAGAAAASAMRALQILF